MDVGARLQLIMDQKGYNGNSLAKISDVSQAMISNLVRGAKNPTVGTLELLCSAMNITLAEFFAEPSPDIRPAVQHLISVASKLPDEKVEALISVAKAME